MPTAVMTGKTTVDQAKAAEQAAIKAREAAEAKAASDAAAAEKQRAAQAKAVEDAKKATQPTAAIPPTTPQAPAAPTALADDHNSKLDEIKHEVKELLQLLSDYNESPDEQNLDFDDLKKTVGKVWGGITSLFGPSDDEKKERAERGESGVAGVRGSRQISMRVDAEKSREIARDHLVEELKNGKEKEDQEYYTKLKKVHENKCSDSVPAFWRRNLDYGSR